MENSNRPMLLYCRVSDRKQVTDGHGLESQEHRGRQYAAEHNLAIEGVFHDDVTGGGNYNKRPAMNDILSHIKANPHKKYLVYVDDIRRVARDVYFYWGLIRELEEYGADPVSRNFVFEKTPEGRFQQSITVAAGEYERDSIKRQTLQKMIARMEAGYHVFIAPVGFKYYKSKEHGKVLVPDEPAASVIAEAITGMATGRFQTKREMKRFLEASSGFPKTASGKVGNNCVPHILANPLYAGYVGYEPWGISVRPGKHEGLVSYETFLAAQARSQGRSYAPARSDLNQLFPLRGSVSCVCGNNLTGAPSRSQTGKLYHYYVCQNKKCDVYGKSIRAEKLHGEFEAFLENLTPSEAMVSAADKMFNKLWEHRASSETARKQLIKNEMTSISRKTEQILERIIEAESPIVVKAFEKKVNDLEKQRLVCEEKLAKCGKPTRPYRDMSRTPMLMLSKPHKLWALGGFEMKQTVIKCVMTAPIIYDRNEGYRTPELSIPFKVLGGFFGSKSINGAQERT